MHTDIGDFFYCTFCWEKEDMVDFWFHREGRQPICVACADAHAFVNNIGQECCKDTKEDSCLQTQEQEQSAPPAR